MRLEEITKHIAFLEEEIPLVGEQNLSLKEQQEERERLFLEWLSLGEDFESKVQACIYYLQELEQRMALIDSLVKDYQSRKLGFRGEHDKLREVILGCLIALNKTSVRTALGTVSVRNKPDKLILLAEPEDLPQEFWKPIEVRLGELKKFVKANPNCKMARLEPQGQSLSIRVCSNKKERL